MNFCPECGVKLVICQHMDGCSLKPRAPAVAWIAYKEGQRVQHFSVADGWIVEEVLTK